MKNLLKSKKGFTLVELIVVIVIIAILAAALVTSLVGYIAKAGDTTALLEAQNAYTAAQAVISEKVGTDKTASICDNGSTTAIDESKILTDVNTYLGSEVVTAEKMTVVTINAQGTIDSFTYVANNRTVTYTTAAGWQVA